MSFAMFLLLFPVFSAAQVKEDKDWAKYDRYAQANDTISVAPKAVFMGNSITFNWYKLRPEFFKDNNYAGRGISGQTTYQMLARFHNDVVALKPKAVVILSGINDIARNSGYISVENIMGNIISMCDIARANGITPILCSVLPCDWFSWRTDIQPAPMVKELNRFIKTYAQEHKLEYVDYYTPMADENGALKEGLSNDRCHPVSEAYAPMEEAVKRAIDKVVKKRKRK